MNTTDDQSALRDDLAFLRALATGDNEPSAAQRGTALVFVAGGVLYAAQCFVMVAPALGWMAPDGVGMVVASVLPTVLFLAALAVILPRHRDPSPGVVSRALAAAFQAAGTATLALLCCFGIVVWRYPSLVTWLLFPCAVFTLQGAAWLVAGTLRRKVWVKGVGIGWLASAVLLASSIGSVWFPIVAGLALLLLMALPGAWMLRR